MQVFVDTRKYLQKMQVFVEMEKYLHRVRSASSFVIYYLLFVI